MKSVIDQKIETKTYAGSAMRSFSILLLAFTFCIVLRNLKARYLLVELDQAAERSKYLIHNFWNISVLTLYYNRFFDIQMNYQLCSYISYHLNLQTETILWQRLTQTVPKMKL